MQSKKICYCFNYTEQDIIDDVTENNGICIILENIMSHKIAGSCNCMHNHPQGR